MYKLLKILSGLVLLIVILFISNESCKKKKEKITISGYIYDINENSPASNVHVSLLAKEISSGAWNSNYQSVSSATTGSDGKFSFKFDVITVSGYRLVFDKLNYFTVTNDFSGNVVSEGGEYNKSYQIFPVAFLKIHIKNTSPYDIKDYMSYKIIGGTSNGFDCCSDTTSNFYGRNIDLTRICKIFGNQSITIDWRSTKNNNPHFSTTNVTCPSLDTTSVDLFY